jgi:hypothetical protein
MEDTKKHQGAGHTASEGSKGPVGPKHEHERGGTHEQHVKSGHAGGEAHHACRGRQCEEKE